MDSKTNNFMVSRDIIFDIISSYNGMNGAAIGLLVIIPMFMLSSKSW